jgi:glycosyltransferase involved in cell wall biosynthesis
MEADLKSILLVVDSNAWAWGHMAAGIAKFATDDYRVTVLDQSTLAVMLRKDPEYVEPFAGMCHFSWTEAATRKLPIRRLTTLLASHGFEFPFPPIDPQNIAASISTPLRNSDRALVKFKDFDAFLCVSDRIYNAAEHYTTKDRHRTPPGVDHEFFESMPLPNGDKLRVGWCGQKPENGRNNTKGYREVLLPLISRIGEQVEFVVNDRNATNALSQDEMRDWYRDIDVILSTSCSEGFQMPLLEAASCGRPCVATNVGGAMELVGESGFGGWISPGWSVPEQAAIVVDCLGQTLLDLAGNRKAVHQAGQFARDRVESTFTWARRAPEWLKVIGG